jgi:hypothetical protein
MSPLALSSYYYHLNCKVRLTHLGTTTNLAETCNLTYNLPPVYTVGAKLPIVCEYFDYANGIFAK